MSTLIKISCLVTMYVLATCFLSCDDDELPPFPSECTVEAFYRGTNVCHDGEYAAAIEIVSNNKYLILENFFTFPDLDALTYEEVIYVDFEEVDLDETSPALCGALIVAPVSNLTCISVE